MNNAIHIENLNVSYDNTQALKDINLDVQQGEFLGIMGPNGGGKSTFLKAILGLIPKDSGKVTFFGKEDTTKDIGYVPQFSLVDKKFPISVVEVVMTAMLKDGIHPFFKFNSKHKEKAIKCLEEVGIKHLYKRQISELSGGEFQRLLIARALAVDPKILLLDEPTASVDPKSKEAIYNLLEQLNNKITIVMITHDLEAISSKVKKIACLNETLVYHGSPQLTNDVVTKLYGCPVDLIAHGVPHRVLGAHEGECNHKC